MSHTMIGFLIGLFTGANIGLIAFALCSAAGMRETRPVKFREANSILFGRGVIADLPVHNNGENITSCWKIPFLKRFRVLLTGRVYLVVRGKSHPPLWIDTEAFASVDKKSLTTYEPRP